MAFDAVKNFATSTIATAPSPAISGTTLTIQAGDGVKFPIASFNAVIYPNGELPTVLNAEIVRVTNIASDTFTITRTQEATVARTILVGDQIAQAVTAKTLTDIQSGTNFPIITTGALSATTGAFSDALSATTGTFSGAVSGTDGIFTGTLTVAGATTIDDVLDVNGVIRATGINAAPTTGKGVEINFNSVNDVGAIRSYNRVGGIYYGLQVECSVFSVAINSFSGAVMSVNAQRLHLSPDMYISGSEGTAPAAPSSGGYRIYCDEGAGPGFKTRLMVLFGSGAAQQIAIEP